MGESQSVAVGYPGYCGHCQLARDSAAHIPLVQGQISLIICFYADYSRIY